MRPTIKSLLSFANPSTCPIVPLWPIGISTGVIWQLVFGLLLMLAGGESLVRGAIALAERFGISPLVIGVTLVGFGTSAPELATCIDAALRNAPGIAVGNVIGSNIANVLLILAVAALLRPIACHPHVIRRDGAAVLASGIVCTITVLFGYVDRWMGAVFLAVLTGYLIAATLDDRNQGKNEDEGRERASPTRPLLLDLSLLIFGLGGVLIGADLLVTSAIDLAERLGVSQATIGLSVIAIGTSLPELVTVAVASFKRQGDLAFGNVIGSNIFNVFGILGATALVQPITIPADVTDVDIWVMLGATLMLLLFAITNWRISRREGAVLLMGYFVYLGFLVRTMAF
jgi:cation:H+ antiporter